MQTHITDDVSQLHPTLQLDSVLHGPAYTVPSVCPTAPYPVSCSIKLFTWHYTLVSAVYYKPAHTWNACFLTSKCMSCA